MIGNSQSIIQLQEQQCAQDTTKEGYKIHRLILQRICEPKNSSVHATMCTRYDMRGIQKAQDYLTIYRNDKCHECMQSHVRDALWSTITGSNFACLPDPNHSSARPDPTGQPAVECFAAALSWMNHWRSMVPGQIWPGQVPSKPQLGWRSRPLYPAQAHWVLQEGTTLNIIKMHKLVTFVRSLCSRDCCLCASADVSLQCNFKLSWVKKDAMCARAFLSGN